MNEADRIRALRDEGRIDDAQAERLLAAIGALAEEGSAAPPAGERTTTPPRPSPAADGAPATARGDALPDADVFEEGGSVPNGAARRPADDPVDAQGAANRGRHSASATAESSTAATASTGAPGADSHRNATTGPDSVPGQGPALGGTASDAEDASAAATGAPSATEAAVDRWVRVELLAGDLDVRIDPSLDAPVAEADDAEIDVDRDGGTWRVSQRSRNGGSWIDRLMSGMKRSDLRLRLPARTGVELDVKAGDVDLRDVAAVRGRLLAGDLEARGLRAIDLALEVGDLDVELDPLPGRHRIRMSVGEAGVRLPRDAHVDVTGRVSVGDARAPEPFRTTRSTVAERIEGRLGEGRATLNVDVGTGTIDLEVR